MKDYYDKGVKAVSPDAYMILEHWGNNMGTERPQLISYGMQCWNNTSNAYCQTAMGWLKDGDGFGDANRDGYVAYCESHDVSVGTVSFEPSAYSASASLTTSPSMG